MRVRDSDKTYMTGDSRTFFPWLLSCSSSACRRARLGNKRHSCLFKKRHIHCHLREIDRGLSRSSRSRNLCIALREYPSVASRLPGYDYPHEVALARSPCHAINNCHGRQACRLPVSLLSREPSQKLNQRRCWQRDLSAPSMPSLFIPAMLVARADILHSKRLSLIS